jgi:predicted GNAT superfamily acetyltransferase
VSLYAQYIQERLGKHIVESDKGFATYYFINEGVYIEDLYVVPEARQSGEATRLADEIASIAKQKGYTKMYGSVKPTSKNSTTSLKVLLAYGFELLEAGPDAVILVKGI